MSGDSRFLCVMSIVNGMALVNGGAIFASGFSLPSGVATADLDLDLLAENVSGVAKDLASYPE